MDSLLARCTGVIEEPFPHIVIEDALPEYQYRALEEGFPACRWDDIHQRHDIMAQVLLKEDITHTWREFIEYHTSREFWLELVDLFKPDLSFLPDDYKVGIRKRDGHYVSMDCQASFNTKVVEPGRIRGPHVDDTKQVFGGLFYMPERSDTHGGDLYLYTAIKKIRMIPKAEIADDCVERVKVVPYKRNTLVMMVNGIDAIHGVGIRQPTEIPRRFINLTSHTKKRWRDWKPHYVSKEEWKCS